MALSQAQKQFFQDSIGSAQTSETATSVPASVTLAQGMLESDWGRSRLAREANNLFGIKATPRADDTFDPGPIASGVFIVETQEFDDHGQPFTVQAVFRKYTSRAD